MIEFIELPGNSIFFLIFSFVLGLLFGSFANVVIYRLPLKQSVVWPGSHCPGCKKKIRWFDNIPLCSWILLRGQCRSCKTAISFKYPLVELLMATLFSALYFKFGLTWTFAEFLLLGFGLVVVSAIDLKYMILPDVFTLSGIVLGLLGSWLNPEREFTDALLGLLVGGGFLYSIALVYFLVRKAEGLGGGDIKLIAWLGAYLGWSSVPFILFVASIAGSFVGIFLSIRSKKGMQNAIPFGPFLAGAGILYLFFFDRIQEWYLLRLT